MNAFREHHHDSIRFHYSCFDRLLLNGVIQPFQQGERVVRFFNIYRKLYPVTRKVLTGIASSVQDWVKTQAKKWRVPILEAPRGRRDEFVDRYFRRPKPDAVVCIIKAREPARIMTAIGNQKTNRWHLELKNRYVDQYNFYVNDTAWGRMFVRICPYFPFSARICLNQHHWLANQMRQRGIGFEQCGNAFLNCAAPDVLQKLADSLTAADLSQCGEKWLGRLMPFFTASEREHAGVQHRLFFCQVEYSDNLVFHRRAALDRLGERLLDANRTIGQPDKLTVIFGRKVTRRLGGKLKTVIEDLHLGSPVMRSHYKNGFIKQYVRDDRLLRTEATSNNIRQDYEIPKAIQNLPRLREKQAAITDRYLDVQQDILESFVRRGQLEALTQCTVLPNGKRIPGLKLTEPRQLALMQALVRFSQVAAGSFTTREIHAATASALRRTTDDYKLSCLRYDLSKLRAKGLVKKLPHSRRYQLTPEAYRICLVFLTLFRKFYAPLTSAVLCPYAPDKRIPAVKITKLDKLYRRVNAAFDELADAIGLQPAA